MGILSLLLWTPVFGVLLLAVTPSRHFFLIRLIAHSSTTLTLLTSLWLVMQFDTHRIDLQFSEYFPINPELGSAYALGTDGLSLPMLIMTSLLTSITLLASLTIKQSTKGYHTCLLLLEFGMLGVFSAQNWALFYFFWEITLIPLFFLINRWGGKHRHTASLNFMFYFMGGSVFMLISLLAINQYDFQQGNSLMIAMQESAKTMPLQEQILVLLGFIIGFGVTMPIFPLHGWLLSAYAQAPSPINILLSGVVLNMGAYGLLRVAVILPEATQALQPLLILLALFGMLYGCLLAWRYRNLVTIATYTSISQMAIILTGIATLSTTGISGAILQMAAHGLTTGSLFLLIGFLGERTNIRNLSTDNALLLVMPRFTFLIILTLLAGMGLPGFIGFIALLHILISGIQEWPFLMIFFLLSMLIINAYSIRSINLLVSRHDSRDPPHFDDLRTTELIAASVLALCIVFLGIFPSPWLDLSTATSNQISHILGQNTL